MTSPQLSSPSIAPQPSNPYFPPRQKSGSKESPLRKSPLLAAHDDEITPIRSRDRGNIRNYDSTGNSSTSASPESRRVDRDDERHSGNASHGQHEDGFGDRRQTNEDVQRAGAGQANRGEVRQRRDGGQGESGKRNGRGLLHAGNGERGEEEEADGGRWGWLMDLVDQLGSVELENKGSVARDHLALERTFLAWLRTSLAFASIGIAVTQLFRLNTAITDREGMTPDPAQSGQVRLRQVGKPLGATFLGIAILVLGVGGRRYFESQYWIIRGKFPASRGSVFLIAFVTLALIVTSLVVVCVVDPTHFKMS